MPVVKTLKDIPGCVLWSVLKQYNGSQNLSVPQFTRGGLVKYRLLGPTSRVSDSVLLGWSPGTYLSNKFPDPAAASLKPTF